MYGSGAEVGGDGDRDRDGEWGGEGGGRLVFKRTVRGGIRVRRYGFGDTVEA